MKQFTRKISWFALLLLGETITLFILPFFLPQNSTDYFAAYIDKHELLNSTPPPRIIIIGGSSAAFGVDSQMIAKETGYSVVNMGLNVGMGLRYTLEEVRTSIGEGDIILISSEYEQFGTAGGNGAPPVLIAITPTSLKYMTSPKQYLSIFTGLNIMARVEIMHLIGAIRKKAVKCTGGLYCRSSFDAHGDFIAHLEQPSRLKIPEHITPLESTPSQASLQSIKNFTHYANGKGAQVLFTFPPLARSYFEPNRKAIESIEEEINKIPDLVVIDLPEDREYANEMFFDSEYHLNKEGRNMRTDQILSTSSIAPLRR